MKSNDNIVTSAIFGGIIAAVATSLCCLTPVLALFAGISGMAATFSWVEPLRPYLVGITVLILGFAWYQRLKPRSTEEIACDCESDAKISFLKTKKFLASVTIVATFLVTFPYYSGLFFHPINAAAFVVEQKNVVTATIKIHGMTCTGCEHSVNKALGDLPGVIKVSSDFQTGLAKVNYDKTRIGFEKFRETIVKKVGYKVVNIKVADL